MLLPEEEVLVGLEIHVTLKTEKKVFNSTNSFLKKVSSDNDDFSNIGPWELGHLGTIPSLNHEVVKFAVKLCSALSCHISEKVVFDRKIYSYFDLPKGFQITQERHPIGRNGFLPTFCQSEFKKIPIEKVQIEEDTAKSSYQENETLLDFRRSGNPLLEIVTKPVFNSSENLLSFARQLRSLLVYLGISDAKMELGQFRVDMNFSFKKGFYRSPRYEVKNLNSFRNLKNSFDQLLRQQREKSLSFNSNNLQEPKALLNETLGYDELTQKIFFQREKSSYFYVEEHNILPVVIEERDFFENSFSENYLPWELLKPFSSEKKEQLLENTFLVKLLRSFKIEGLDYSAKTKELLSFFSNFLVPFLNTCKEEPLITQEKTRNFWLLMCFCFESKLNREKVVKAIFGIFGDSNYLLEKESLLKEEEDFVAFQKLEEEAWKIITDQENSKKVRKIISDRSKIFSFIFGILKVKFSQKAVKHEDVKLISEKVWKEFNSYKG